MMMRLSKLGLLPLCASVAIFAGCSGRAAKVASSPQAKQDQKAAEQIVQGCLTHGNFLSHSGRRAVLRCMAPPGQEAAFQKCAQQALAHDGVLTSSQRKRLYQDLAICVERHR